MVDKLAQHENFLGMKECTGNVRIGVRLCVLLQLCKGHCAG